MAADTRGRTFSAEQSRRRRYLRASARPLLYRAFLLPLFRTVRRGFRGRNFNTAGSRALFRRRTLRSRELLCSARPERRNRAAPAREYWKTARRGTAGIKGMEILVRRSYLRCCLPPISMIRRQMGTLRKSGRDLFHLGRAGVIGSGRRRLRSFVPGRDCMRFCACQISGPKCPRYSTALNMLGERSFDFSATSLPFTSLSPFEVRASGGERRVRVSWLGNYTGIGRISALDSVTLRRTLPRLRRLSRNHSPAA